MVWQRFAKSPGESLCRFDSCRLRHSNVWTRSSEESERKLAELEVAGSSPAGFTNFRDQRSEVKSQRSDTPA